MQTAWWSYKCTISWCHSDEIWFIYIYVHICTSISSTNIAWKDCMGTKIFYNIYWMWNQLDSLYTVPNPNWSKVEKYSTSRTVPVGLMYLQVAWILLACSSMHALCMRQGHACYILNRCTTWHWSRKWPCKIFQEIMHWRVQMRLV